MAGFSPTPILHGSGGKAWFNGKRLATLQSVEIKVTGNFEDINVCGDNKTYQVFNGFAVDGTLTLLKMDSDTLKLLDAAYHSGEMPDMSITTNLTQKGTGKSERVEVSGVVITEYMLAKFEKMTKSEEEIPFKGEDFHVLDTI